METKTIAELGIKQTSLEGSYWNHKGAYQEEGDRLYDEMVPASGAAATVNGEMIRGINRLFYEYCNNGNCNAAVVTRAGDRDWWDVDENEEDGGDPDEVVDVEIDPYYEKFLTLIQERLSERIDEREVDALVSAVREVIVSIGYMPDMMLHLYFSKENVNAYSRLCDAVIWYVLNTQDADLPSDYDRS